MTKNKALLIAFIAFMAGAFLVYMGDNHHNNIVEEMGDGIHEVVDETGDAIEDAADDVDDAMD